MLRVILFVGVLIAAMVLVATYNIWHPRSHQAITSDHRLTAKASVSVNKLQAAQGSAAAINRPMFSVSQTDGLVTNEFAYYNQTDPAAIVSTDWDVTSGSLFAHAGSFWTGVPDSCNGSNGPNASSSNCTDSNVFRANSKAIFSDSIEVSLSLMQLTDPHNPNCNANDTCWHGTHIWLRDQSQYNLYYISLNRADGEMVIKRKVPCGDDNGGTYFVLGKYVKHDFKFGTWNSYSARITTNPSGSVTIQVFDTNWSNSIPVVQGTDTGGTNPNWSPNCTIPGKYSSAHYSPIVTPGSIGVRGDYADFLFKNLVVTKY
jgi:hypothetical protein